MEYMKNKKLFSAKIFASCCVGMFIMSGCDSDGSFSDTEPGVSLGIVSTSNMRDLGGYTTVDGRTVKRNLVYRSNKLYEINPDDMEKIEALNLKNVFDLRRDGERLAEPDEVPTGVNYVVLDVLAGMPESGLSGFQELIDNPEQANIILGGGAVEEGFEASYRQTVSRPSAKKAFGELLAYLGDENQLPALFHCSTGKDRTGWAAAIFLTILGVPEDVVMQDYMRSNEYILSDLQDTIDAFIAGGGEESIILPLLGVEEEYLEAAFTEMESKYGNIETYFSEALGIDVEQQEALRDLYLE
jgi:protein-tyrosine phosphatase